MSTNTYVSVSGGNFQNILKGFLRRFSFPIMFGSSFALGFYLLSQGHNPLAVNAPILIVTSLLLWALERYIPFDPDWAKVTRKDALPDTGFHIIEALATPPVQTLVFFLFVEGNSLLFSKIGYQIWPREWPLFFQFLLALLWTDFVLYWVHRWGHEKSLVLWRIHSVHHSPKKLYFLNARRQHPLQIPIAFSLAFLPLGLMGAEGTVLFIMGLFISLHTNATHANADFKIGFLNKIFNMAEVHRWHHSTKLEEGNANYSITTTLFDYIFNTRYFPKDREFAAGTPVGLAHLDEEGQEEPQKAEDYPTDNLGKMLLYPFRRGV